MDLSFADESIAIYEYHQWAMGSIPRGSPPPVIDRDLTGIYLNENL